MSLNLYHSVNGDLRKQMHFKQGGLCVRRKDLYRDRGRNRDGSKRVCLCACMGMDVCLCFYARVSVFVCLCTVLSKNPLQENPKYF